MADTLAITGLLNQAGTAYDSGDLAFILDLFLDDSVFELVIAGNEPMVFAGKDNIRALFEGAHETQTDQRRHCVTNIYFTDETDTSVTAVSTLILISVENGALTVLSSGVYTDSVVLSDGAWKLQRRHLHLDLPY
ncbi:MAG: nuclear transport factor 2 family protein [bacterium]|nr:nuclear transport factor 2 family protein [bacterium]